MELDLFELYLNNPLQESSLFIPIDSPNGDYFYIYFVYVHHQITSSPTQPDVESIITINRTLLVPREILCNCDEATVMLDNDNTTFLHESFSFVPVPLQRLYEILPRIGEFAREMVVAHQGHNVWEMNVTLHVTTWPDEDEDDDDDYIDLSEDQNVLQSTSQIMDLLKEVNTAQLPFYSADQCAICLEEFCTRSKLEVVSTKCLHIFHKECIIQWLQKCTSRSCPLCRCLLKLQSNSVQPLLHPS